MHRFKTWHLFAACVLVWSATWHAITYQIEGSPPELAVALRFGLAGLVVLAGCAWRGIRLEFSARQHGLFALQGVFMYSLAYLGVYHAEERLPSGVVAVAYSASPILNGLGAHMLWGVKVTRRFLAGGALGIAGVALIFAPELGHAQGSGAAALGVVFTLASVLLSSIGSLTASRNRTGGMPLWPAMGFGMLYGALSSALVLAILLSIGGIEASALLPPARLSWWLALLYLSLAGSVLAFAAWLTLQDRVGPGPSSAVGAMVPVLAVLISVAFEGYRPGALTLAGLVLAVWGNVWMLRR